MGNFEPWQSTARQRSTRTGIIAIAAIMALIFGMLAVFLLWTFRVQRPAQAAAGTATAQQEANLAATATGAAEATHVAELLPLTPDAAWDWNQTETFDTNVQSWDLRPPQGEQGITREIVDGRLLWTVASDDRVFSSLYAPRHEVFSDCLLAVDATIEEGPTEHLAYGLGLRATEDGFYFFEVSGAGTWRFLIFEDEWKTLASGSSSAINTRSGNRLALRAQGHHFTLFVNDTRVGEAVDSALDRGEVGLIVEAFEQDVRGSITFDNLSMNCQRTELADSLLLTPSPGWQWEQEDLFTSNDNGWEIGEIEVGGGTLDRQIDDERYVWTVHTEEPMIAWTEGPAHGAVSDCLYSVLINYQSGPTWATQFGILLRANDDSGYVFLIELVGEWRFVRYDDGTPVTLAEGTRSTVIRRRSNILAVRAEGNQFHLFVNDEKLATVQDDTYPTGQMGLALEVPVSKAFAVISYDFASMRCSTELGE